MTYEEDRVERIAFDCWVKFPCLTVINDVVIAPCAKFLAIVAMGYACLVPVVVY